MKNPRFETHKNDEGVWRVKIFAEGGGPSLEAGRWLEDGDTMTVMVSSHRSKAENFPSSIAANQAGTDWVRHVNLQEEMYQQLEKTKSDPPKPIIISDTFKKIS